MSMMNILSLTLIALILGCVLALVIGTRPAEAGVFGTPAGGWGIDRPAPPAPPTDGFFPGDISGGSI